MAQDYSIFSKLIESHKYADAATEARKMLPAAVDDLDPIQCLAEALFAAGDYTAALPLYEQIDAAERADKGVRGLSGRRNYLACIHWMLGDRAKGIALFAELVDGILNGSIEFGDIAGGVQQGLLLNYMGVTAGDEAAKEQAMKYLRNRAKRSAAKFFPGHVARFYLNQATFADILVGATERLEPGKGGGTPDLAAAMELARADLLTRRFMCVALFHDGVMARAGGNENSLHDAHARVL